MTSNIWERRRRRMQRRGRPTSTRTTTAQSTRTIEISCPRCATMKIPPTITFRRLRAPEALERDIRQRLAKLERYCPSLDAPGGIDGLTPRDTRRADVRIPTHRGVPASTTLQPPDGEAPRSVRRMTARSGEVRSAVSSHAARTCPRVLPRHSPVCASSTCCSRATHSPGAGRCRTPVGGARLRTCPGLLS
jgi:hypothetical protein